MLCVKPLFFTKTCTIYLFLESFKKYGVVLNETVIKQEAINAIESLPDAVNFEEIMYRLYVLEKVHQGQTAILNGNIKNLAELKQEAANW